jgi:hypothetical protein
LLSHYQSRLQQSNNIDWNKKKSSLTLIFQFVFELSTIFRLKQKVFPR